eukprot:CAMPEP_0206266526 /NCGR_PEP_ID=MMETSP0047_2-20121206/30624_1 /ASSEMBLY_ACC=CAM_ASM_000192 /TAXON_ID=195065 /ORGANISM="Chroomonas mesostigmatica_cf, Strain CCMP1168" /LENGTH=51 /DNA_ID=CAMNT_0053694591 /DNA_START=53 /DNA_END=204 /DNA_ORIENTATION=+
MTLTTASQPHLTVLTACPTLCATCLLNCPTAGVLLTFRSSSFHWASKCRSA